MEIPSDVVVPPVPLTKRAQRRKSTASAPPGGPAIPKKKTRSKADNDDNELGEEELKLLYQNKNYEPPRTRQFETIFEAESVGKKRGVTEELAIGKHKSKRFLEPHKYWLDDKAKTRQRSKMTSKSFKGRGKFQITALTPEEESSLIKLIQEKSDDEEVEQEEENVTPNKPKTRQKETNTPARKSSANRKSKTPSKYDMPPKELPVTITAKSSPVKNLNSPGQPTSTQTSQSGGELDIYTENLSQEEMLKKIQEAGSFFGVVAEEETEATSKIEDIEDTLNKSSQDENTSAPLEKENSTKIIEKEQTKRKPNTKLRRDSVSVQVRRSSRFFGSSECSGSVFRMEEFNVNKKKSRRSGFTFPLKCYDHTIVEENTKENGIEGSEDEEQD